jgi:hypothetical protein
MSTLEEFNYLHGVATIDYTRLDKELGYQWHGKPKESMTTTLETLSFWKSPLRFSLQQSNSKTPRPYASQTFFEETGLKINPLLALFGKAQTDVDQSLFAMLLAYTPTLRTRNASPSAMVKSPEKVVYCFNRHKAVSAYMEIFSPLGSTTLNQKYVLIFDRSSSLLQ